MKLADFNRQGAEQMLSSQDFVERMRATRERVHQGSVPNPSPPSPVDLTPLTGLSGLCDRVADVQSRQTLSEQPFRSNIPLLGRLVVRVRLAWNWMSTRWYIRPLMQQQNSFNAIILVHYISNDSIAVKKGGADGYSYH